MNNTSIPADYFCSWCFYARNKRVTNHINRSAVGAARFENRGRFHLLWEMAFVTASTPAITISDLQVSEHKLQNARQRKHKSAR